MQRDLYFINGADLNNSQLAAVKLAWEEGKDPLWVERHNFSFDVKGNLYYIIEIDQETLKLQQEDFIRDFDKDARYELPEYSKAFVC